MEGMRPTKTIKTANVTKNGPSSNPYMMAASMPQMMATAKYMTKKLWWMGLNWCEVSIGEGPILPWNSTLEVVDDDIPSAKDTK